MTVETEAPAAINHAFEGDNDDSERKNADVENAEGNGVEPEEKIRYPNSVLFIVVTEFCERFSFYGLRTILSLYLHYKLHYDLDLSTVIFHVFVMLCYITPFLGAIVADSWLGKFRTIFFFSLLYAFGNITVSVAAIPDILPPREITIIGLIFITFGTGGIKPCVSAFGGDQFVLPQQEKSLRKFFSLFYFAINSGSFLSTLVTPILREDIKCFGEDSCFSLAFGIPALLMVSALVIFTSGKRWYVMKKPEGNIIVKVGKCIWHAFRRKTTKEYDHWLYKAEDKYDRKFIQDIIATLRVLVLFIPLPIFWALFDQQGSRWTFQATRTEVDVGGFRIKPDQMQVMNPVLILIFIPIFQSVIYPALAKFNLLTRPLQKITVGGLLAAASFAISAVVELELEKTYPILPEPGEGQLRLLNTMSGNLSVSIIQDNGAEVKDTILVPMKMYEDLHIRVENHSAQMTVKTQSRNYPFTISDGKAVTGVFIDGTEAGLKFLTHEDMDKSKKGDPRVMIIVNDKAERGTVILKSNSGTFSFNYTSDAPVEDFSTIPTDEYKVTLEEKEVGKVHLKQGGIYSLAVTKTAENYKVNLLTITPPNNVCILWMIPQYAMMTAGEVMFSITGLEFSFTQAPVSMKSLMQAIWLFTTAIGNMVVVIIAEAKIFRRQAYEFLLFTGLMALDMVVFALMAVRYTYVEDMEPENKDLELEDSKDEKS